MSISHVSASIKTMTSLSLMHFFLVIGFKKVIYIADHIENVICVSKKHFTNNNSKNEQHWSLNI